MAFRQCEKGEKVRKVEKLVKDLGVKSRGSVVNGDPTRALGRVVTQFDLCYPR